jgi:hypothetical protein
MVRKRRALYAPQTSERERQVKRYIEVVEYESGKVVHKVDVTDKSERQSDRVMDGMDRNLNHEKFYTRHSAAHSQDSTDVQPKEK